MPMTPVDYAWYATWRPASGHPSGRWRVVRECFDGRGLQEACGATGRVRLFGSCETAQRAATKLNWGDQTDA